MYLSRFEINTARRGARHLMASPQRLHAAVLAAFPPSVLHTDDGAGRVLWRLDLHDHRALLYLVSPHQPDLTHLVEQAGWPTQHGWDTREYKPLLEQLAVGQQWGFRLTANPVSSRRKSAESTRSQRFAHVTVQQQTNWLLERAGKLGFTVVPGVQSEPDVAVRRRDTLRFNRNGHTVTLAVAVFEGRLEVVDPDALRTALTLGIGAGKGYGCGLLTLAPIG